MTHRIEIYDTTLRDGSQGEGVNFSVDDKIRVAEQLDAFEWTSSKADGPDESA